MELHLHVDELNEGWRCDILYILHVFVFLRLNDWVVSLCLLVLLARDCLELEAINVLSAVLLMHVLHCCSALLYSFLLDLLCSQGRHGLLPATWVCLYHFRELIYFIMFTL